MRRLALLLLLACPQIAEAAPPPGGRTLHVESGPNVSDFVQNESLTVHTIVRTNGSPRVMFATPAGNSGVGLWFKPVDRGGLAVEQGATAIEANGRAGVAVKLRGPARLELDRVMLDSMRALRDKDHGDEGSRDKLVKDALAVFDSPAGKAAGISPEMIDRLRDWSEPKELRDPARPGALILERRALGSGARYRVEIVPEVGTSIAREDGRIVLRGDAGTHFSVRSFIDRAPLEPLAHVMAGPHDPAQERNLGLLVYKDKFLAGSYQYLTYFGRDTMISSKLLGQRLTPEALGTAVGSVLDRISAHGRVAHEESNGDQATLEKLPKLMKTVQDGKKISGARMAELEKPVHDYKMMDGEFLLPPLLADYAARATPAELAQTMSPPRLDALARVLTRVLDETRSFSGASVSDLVHLRRGQIVGNWRDSGEGLGNGRTPLDVNAYLVPAALEAVDRLVAQPGFPRQALEARLSPDARAQLGTLAVRRATWRAAAQKFEVRVAPADARTRLRSFVDSLPEAEREALSSQKLWSGASVKDALEHGAPELADVRFPGVSLDQHGKPTPVLSSDEAFQLFYGAPTAAEVKASVTRLFQPFPVGLMTEVGMVVANPAYSTRPDDRTLFDRAHYHGAVVWSWPQTMMRRGLEKQLERHGSDPEVKAIVTRALGELDRVEKNVGAMKSAELWTWKADGGHVVPVAFGASAKDTTEGAALQLWSNTY